MFKLVHQSIAMRSKPVARKLGSSDEGETTLGSGETGVINERCIEIEEQSSNIYQEHKNIDDIHPKNHSPQPSIQEKVAAALSSYPGRKQLVTITRHWLERQSDLSKQPLGSSYL
ncbi:hypothetical protein PV327_005208 [Microctonus hyperodae]|uniref:Uncharacterized protein n=1 Tax=Microctonus hyperodae TaxID=165561 RepID=A0AA39KZK6_MICHY|nr:hypothetical protein PV327_005208 [Microctonus hyperodae]